MLHQVYRAQAPRWRRKCHANEVSGWGDANKMKEMTCKEKVQSVPLNVQTLVTLEQSLRASVADLQGGKFPEKYTNDSRRTC